MTCIIGYLDKENNCSYIGCDSLGSNGQTKAVEKNPKAFRNVHRKDILMGSTSTFRHIDLLKYSENLFDKIEQYEASDIDHKFMVTKFVPKIIQLFKEELFGFNDEEKGASFIVATPKSVYELQADYSVLEPDLPFCSVGCGKDIALGSLFSTKDDTNLTISDKIILALKSAEAISCGVQRPFRIICTNGSEDIIIN